MVRQTLAVTPVCLVTGATSGIGRVTAEAMARAGHRLLMACRDPVRADAVRTGIIERTGNRDVHVLTCDLGSLASVRGCAARTLALTDRLDVLINNAGTMTTRFRASEDGVELTLAVNHLGPWLLTRLLLDRLLATGSARIVNVASAVHRSGRLDTSRLDGETAKGFSGMRAYARSKLANVMTTLSLAEHLAGTGVTANCLHPGVVATNITGDTNALLRIGMKLISPFVLGPEQGAQTTLHLALDPDIADVSGAYFDEHRRRQTPSAAALDRQARAALWAWSSRRCGLSEEIGWADAAP